MNLLYCVCCLLLAILNVFMIDRKHWWRQSVDIYVTLICITSLLPPFMAYDLDYVGCIAILFSFCSGEANIMLHMRGT